MTEEYIHLAINNDAALAPSSSNAQIKERSNSVNKLLGFNDTPVEEIDTKSFTFLTYRSFISEVFGDLIPKKMEVIDYNDSDLTFTVGESEYFIEGILNSGISMKKLGEIIKAMVEKSKKEILYIYCISIDVNDENNRMINIMFKNDSIISQSYQAVHQEIDPQIGM